VPERRVALVTGGAKRLGRQISLALANAGFDVAVNFHESRQEAEHTVEEIMTRGVRSIKIQADVSRRDQVRRMVLAVKKELGRIDLLVNNSAIFAEVRLADVTDKIWDRTLDINLKGVFLCSQAVIPIMHKQDSGCIVNIASVGGILAYPRHIPYSVSKAGVIMLTRCLAKSLAPKIRVNAVAPGTILLPGEQDPDTKMTPKKRIPMKAYGKASDIAEAVLYFALRAPYVTGQVLSVDGGRSIQ
jgi:NAD(P)-dependent dehydrogenase (short-subunit alcohol dehydrogenase family)